MKVMTHFPVSHNKLKEVEEKLLMKDGEIRVLRDSIRHAQQEKEQERQSQLLVEKERAHAQGEKEKELLKKVTVTPPQWATCSQSDININYYFTDAFIQSNLQLIILNTGRSPLEQCGVKGLVQGPNCCIDFIVATPGFEPPTLFFSSLLILSDV